MNRNFENRKPTKVYAKSKENQMIIKALNMYGRVPETWELLKEIERLNNIINEIEKWLKYKKEQMEEFELYKRKETGAFWYSTMGNIETFIERIQELKGSDKE